MLQTALSCFVQIILRKKQLIIRLWHDSCYKQSMWENNPIGLVTIQILNLLSARQNFLKKGGEKALDSILNHKLLKKARLTRKSKRRKK